MKKRSKSSNQWLREHFQDEYVKRAHKEGLRSRAIFKLEQLDARERLIKPGAVVVDLGAAPGGWSQYAHTRVGRTGRVIATDILPMPALPGIEFFLGDFTEPAVLEAILTALAGARVDLVISDMAPNISGIGVSDQAKAMYLAELALDFALKTLKPGGSFLVKVFQGEGFPEFQRRLRLHFEQVVVRKPDASRARSREQYLVGKGFCGELRG